MFDKWTQLLTKEHGLVGLSLTRIFFGLAFLYELVINFPVRYLLWGADGFYPLAEYREYTKREHFYTLFDISPSEQWVNILVITGIIVAICYIAGYQTRIMGVLIAVLMFSFYFRNPEITHGGDNILRILFVFLIFARVNTYFSIDAYRKKRAAQAGKEGLSTLIGEHPTLRQIKAVLHNFAWAACITQLIFLYFASGTYKLAGEMWQNGTAIYYASRVQDFYTPWFNDLLWKFEPVIIGMTYFAVPFQVAFPFLLLNRYTKYAAILCACGLHFGIATFMGLVDFSWIMIGCELLLLLDHEYKKVNHWLTRWTNRGQPPKQQAA
jgi:hypothetical protein